MPSVVIGRIEQTMYYSLIRMIHRSSNQIKCCRHGKLKKGTIKIIFLPLISSILERSKLIKQQRNLGAENDQKIMLN
jgi:hypothetical protein